MTFEDEVVQSQYTQKSSTDFLIAMGDLEHVLYKEQPPKFIHVIECDSKGAILFRISDEKALTGCSD